MTISTSASTSTSDSPSRDRPDEILVGVDGSAAAETAVRYAALEADRCGASLRLLHVIPALAIGTLPAPADPLMLADIDPRLSRRRDRVLGSAAKLARTVLPDDHVTTSVVAGDRVSTLLTAAGHARTLVLGAPWHPRIDRLITGSVVGGVAARATVPVVGVPAEWRPEDDRGQIVVAVKSPEDPDTESLVGRAIGIAAERKSRLTVLHAWEFPVVYDNMIATTVEERAWSRIKRGSLAEVIALARGPHTEVEVDYRIFHGQPAHAIVDASSKADLLVIGRRRHAFPFGHLGAVGRTVLRESRCPVEVLPPDPLGTDTPAASAATAP